MTSSVDIYIVLFYTWDFMLSLGIRTTLSGAIYQFFWKCHDSRLCVCKRVRVRQKKLLSACIDMGRHCFVNRCQCLVAAILGKENVASFRINCTVATRIRNSDLRPAMPAVHQMSYRRHLIRESGHSFRLNARYCHNLAKCLRQTAQVQQNTQLPCQCSAQGRSKGGIVPNEPSDKAVLGENVQR